MENLPLDECKDRFFYRIHSRNLDFGVFKMADKGFVGIREKFGLHYLFTEYHFDIGPPHGTVKPYEELEQLPDDMSLEETLGTIDLGTKRPVAFDKPVKEGGRGWYFTDTNESSQEIIPASVENKKLFNWLKEKEKQYKS